MTTTKVNHQAVTKAAQEITSPACPKGIVDHYAEIIERETKYSRLVEAATKLAGWFDADEEVAKELRSVLAEIKEG